MDLRTQLVIVGLVGLAWGGGRWLKGKLPPLAVLEAVRQRGIRVFG